MLDTESNHTVFVLGRDSDAESLGEFRDYLDPTDLVRLPVGRELLTATTDQQVRTYFARFALAWDVAGCSPFTPPQPDTPLPGTTACRADWVPYAHRQDVYAFADGRWLWWQATDEAQWYTLALDAAGTVVTRPVARVDGDHVARISGLDLAHLAAWIMARVTRERPEWEFTAHVHLGGTRTDPSIHLTAHGISDATTTLRTELTRIVQAYNWTNPCDPDDVRFHFSYSHTTAEPGQRLVVITDDDVDD